MPSAIQSWSIMKVWHLHDFFFWSAVFFLVGIFIASLINVTGSLLAIGLLAVILIFFNKKIFLPFLATTIIGSSYYFIFNHYQKPLELKPEGIVVAVKQKINYQELILDNQIKIIAARHPQYNYGDQVTAQGEIKKSQSPFFNGVISYPKIELINKNRGNSVKAGLINLRLAFEENIKKVLPHDKAV